MNTNISVIIVNYNTGFLLEKCLRPIQNMMPGNGIEVILVDNASSDDSVERLKSNYSDFKTIFNAKNVGFGRANNQALALAKGRYVLLLNTDAFIAPDSISKTIAFMDTNPKCGVLGVRLEGRDGVLQPCCRYFPNPWNSFLHRTGLARFFRHVKMVDDMAWPHDEVRACDWVVGCYYLIRKEVIDQIGLFDPRFFLYFEEVDHCFAAKKAGWEVVFYPHTTVIHLGGESAKSAGEITQSGRQIEAIQMESELLYYRKNLGLAMCIMHITLSILGDLLLLLKRLLKRMDPLQAGLTWQHAKLLLTLFWRTRFATQSTR